MALTAQARAKRLETDIFIGGMIFQHAHSMGLDISNDRFHEILTDIRRRLPASQVFAGPGQIDTSQIQGLIYAEFSRRTETLQQIRQREAEAAVKVAGETGADGNKVVPLALRELGTSEDRAGLTARRSYSELPSGESQSGPGSIKFMTEMRSFAVENGIAWATGAPDLLRLGKPALLEIAKAHIQKQDFAALKKDVGLEAKDVVTVAKFANTFHQDGHKVSQDLINNVKAVEPDDAAKRQLLGKSAVQLMDIASKNPRNPEVVHKAAQALVDSYEGDKKKQDKVRKLTDSIEQAVQQDQAATNDKQDSIQENSITTPKVLEVRAKDTHLQVEAAAKKDAKAKADQAIDDDFTPPAATSTAMDNARKKNGTISADAHDRPTETAKADAVDGKNKESKNAPDAKQTAAVVPNPKNKIPQPTGMG